MKKHVIKQGLSLLLAICLLTSFPWMSFGATVTLAPTTPSDTPTIQSESAILIDGKTGEILYEKNASDKHYPASITKLMTALLAIENLKPTDVISFSQEAINSMEWNSSRIGFYVGEQVTTDQALHGLLLMSGNDAANGIAEKVSGSLDQFAVKMTERAKELGAKNTNFVNAHGLHDENHYTTAYDMAIITKALYNNDYFQDIMATTTYQIPATNKTQETRYLSQDHRLLNKLRDSKMYRPDVIGGKTGFTDQARHTLVTIAKRGEIDLIAVVMKGEKQGVYQDTNALLDFGFNNYQPLTLHKPGDVLLSLPIYSIKSGKLYEAGTCDISVTENLSVLAPKSVKPRELQTSLDLPEYLDLGIKEGTTLGKITYMNNNKLLAENQLIVSKVYFKPAPQKANSPSATPQPFLFQINGWVLGSIIVVAGVILYFMKRPRKKKFRHRKMKFSKTLK
ncbi:MAG: serine hydrolase [Cellulosilyticaceae bacterium]